MLWVLKTTDSMRRSFKKLHPKLIFWMDKKILTLKPKVKLFLYLEMLLLIRPNNKISVLRVTGLKILGTKGRHALLKKIWKNIILSILCILKGEFAIQNASKLYFFRKT